MTKVDQVAEQLDQLTLLEAAQLSKLLQEKWGVSAAAPMAVAAMPGMAMPGAGAPAAEEEKTEFDLVLMSSGDKKIQVIKVVRELTGLGLKEAKAVVDEAPKPVKEKVSKAEAEDMAAGLCRSGRPPGGRWPSGPTGRSVRRLTPSTPEHRG